MDRTDARRQVIVLLACVSGLSACGHAESSTKPEARSPRAPTAEPKRAQRPAPTEQIEDYMADHFVIVTYSRDAVINGDLDALREPLQVFAAL
jgi:hypothetical protein